MRTCFHISTSHIFHRICAHVAFVVLITMMMMTIIIFYQYHFNLTQIYCVLYVLWVCFVIEVKAETSKNRGRRGKERKKKKKSDYIGSIWGRNWPLFGIVVAKCNEKIDCSSKTMGKVSHVNESVRNEYKHTHTHTQSPSTDTTTMALLGSSYTLCAKSTHLKCAWKWAKNARASSSSSKRRVTCRSACGTRCSFWTLAKTSETASADRTRVLNDCIFCVSARGWCCCLFVLLVNNIASL